MRRICGAPVTNRLRTAAARLQRVEGPAEQRNIIQFSLNEGRMRKPSPRPHSAFSTCLNVKSGPSNSFLYRPKLPFGNRVRQTRLQWPTTVLITSSITSYNSGFQVLKRANHVLGHEAESSLPVLEWQPSNHFCVEAKVITQKLKAAK